MLGNPTLTDAEDGIVNQEARFNPNTFSNNYLVERPQYAFSYNNREAGPNWVSYQLNKSWLGDEERAEAWVSDYQLRSPLQRTQGNWYTGTDAQIHRGHMVTRSHRNRNTKDQQSTYYTSAMLPQHRDNNSEVFKSAWVNFESYLRRLVSNDNKELYIISGSINDNDSPVTYDERLDFYIDSPPLDSDHPFRQNRINYPDETWKVAIVLEPGQTIADITENTRVIGIITPNSKVPIGLSVDELAAWRNWGNWRFSVDEIEERTGLNLLSNIPQEIQNELEEEPDNGSTIISDLSSSLFSDESIQDYLERPESNLINSLFQPVRTFNKVIFGNESSAKETSFSRSIKVFGSSKITGNQDSVIHFTPIEVSSFKNSSAQNGIIEIGMGEISPNTIGSAQIDSTQIGTAKIGILQINTEHSGLTQISPTQISPTQINFRQNASSNSEISEISFPSSISFDNLLFGDQSSFNLHNSTPEIINRLNDSATNIWSDLLQTETQLDIDFQITDLPTGQLAEATITGFDDTGNPNAGTIYIDSDANGVGWFIDETPLDNSEFTTQNEDSYLLAAAESEANGKYDLLTTVLHELAHLYGFIDGYQGFDDSLSTKKGTTKFIGDDFTATLDGEHLDKQAHPDDLLNTHLAPGMRKLPSQLDVEILQAILKAGGRRQKAEGEELLAKLTSDPLLAISNGDFSISDTTTDSFAWDTRGASGVD